MLTSQSMFVVKAGTVKTALICPPSKDPKKEKYTIVTASLMDIRKLSEQAVSEGSGGEKIL